MIFNISNAASESKYKTIQLSSASVQTLTLTDVEAPNDILKGFLLTRAGIMPLSDGYIYYAFYYPQVNTSNDFEFASYIASQSALMTRYSNNNGFTYDAATKTLTLNTRFLDAIFPAGAYDLLTW